MKKLLLFGLVFASFGITTNAYTTKLDPSIDGTDYTYDAANMLWTVNFDYGDVSGDALCSTTSGSYATVGTPNESGEYCWCRAQHPMASLWVFFRETRSSDECAYHCADGCARTVQLSPVFRAAMFGSMVQTVDLTWYDGDSTISGPSSCTVGSTFVPPTPAARPGYIFTGWKVVTCADKIRNLDDSPGVWGVYYASKSISTGSCTYYNDSTGDFSSDCDAEYFDDLSWGEWKVNFAHGTIYGESKCSAQSGDDHVMDWGSPSSDWTATDSELNSASGNAHFCWCHITKYTPSGGNQCEINSSLWVYHDDSQWESCEGGCPASCGNHVMAHYPFRSALYSIITQ